MEESFFRPCALTIERSFYTQSKHDEQTVSYAYIVLRLVVTAGANCTSRVIIKPVCPLPQLLVAFAVEKHLTILHNQTQ